MDFKEEKYEIRDRKASETRPSLAGNLLYIEKNYSDFIKKWIIRQYSFKNGLPTFTPHIEIYKVIETDYWSNKMLISIKCTLRWLDFKDSNISLSSENYPFEPRLIIKNLVELVSEIKTGVQITSVIKCEDFRIYHFEKTYYWNCWVQLKSLHSSMGPCSPLSFELEFCLIKFSRNEDSVNFIKEKLQVNKTSKNFISGFNYKKMSHSVFLWKDTMTVRKETILRLLNDYNMVLDDDFKRSLTNEKKNMESVYYEEVADVDDVHMINTNLEQKEDPLICEYPYVDWRNRTNDDTILDLRSKEIKHDNFYVCKFRCIRKNVNNEILEIITLMFLVSLTLNENKTVNDFIQIIFTIVALKLVTKKEIYQSKRVNVFDSVYNVSILLISIQTNLFINEEVIINVSTAIFLALILLTLLFSYLYFRHYKNSFKDMTPYNVGRVMQPSTYWSKKSEVSRRFKVTFDKIVSQGFCLIEENIMPERLAEIFSMVIKYYQNEFKNLSKLTTFEWTFKDHDKIYQKLDLSSRNKKVHDIIRCRSNLKNIEMNLEKMFRLNYTYCYMELDFLTYRNLNLNVIGKIYFRKEYKHKDIDIPIDVEIQMLHDDRDI